MAKSRQRRVAERSVTKIQRYQRVFAGPDGRAVLYDLIQSSGMLSSPTTLETNQTMYRMGEQGMVLKILHYLKVNPQQLLERIDEHADEMEE